MISVKAKKIIPSKNKKRRFAPIPGLFKERGLSTISLKKLYHRHSLTKYLYVLDINRHPLNMYQVLTPWSTAILHILPSGTHFQ